MVLKCKLQKAGLVENSEKAVVGLFQGLSIFSTSQLFFLISFLGLIGVLIWFVQPSSQAETSEDSSDDSAASAKKKQQRSGADGDQEEFAKEQSQSVTSAKPGTDSADGALKKRKVTRQIDTIYEAVGEQIEISEEFSSSRSMKLQKQAAKAVSSSTKQLESAIEKSIEDTLDFISSLASPTKVNIEILNENKAAATAVSSQSQGAEGDQESVTRRKIKTKVSLEDTMEQSPDDMVDQLLNDLATDDKEEYAYSKHEKRVAKLNEPDVSSVHTQSTSNLETQSRNSLLDLYSVKHIGAIEDHFSSLSEIAAAIQMAGLEKSQLIFGIDFTISNLENGVSTFSGRSLHYFDENIKNPYQKVIEILGKTLECFDVDGRIPAYGFGDSVTKDRKVFPFSRSGYCLGFTDVLRKYNEIVQDIKLSGPTNFAPLIKEAVRIVKDTKQYHILVIVADGQVTNERQTRNAIVDASKYALSIIMVGVGDGPWDTMHEFDDSLPKRQFDNFQFVNYHEVTENSDKPDEMFALHALMEIPDQYKAIKDLGLLTE